MKIFIVGYEHPYKDKRTYKSVLNLQKIGKVYYQYYGEYYGEKIKNIKEIKFEKMELSKNILHWIKKWKNFDRRLYKEISKVNPNIIYFHYLPFTGSKIFRKLKRQNKKIFFEIHEIIPEQFMAKYYLPFFIKKKLWREFIISLKLSDGLISISKDIINYIFKKGNFKSEYFILPNLALNSVKSNKKNKEISFVGKVNRNLDDEKEILKKLFYYDFKFKIIGMNSEYFKDIPHEYTSFLPYDQMIKELSKSAFSLISFNTIKNRSYKNDVFSLPNKYYDSIAAETPVIVKNTFVSMAKEVEELNIGVVINPKNVSESVEKILKAYENYDELLNNIRKHKEKFIWTEEKDKEYISYILKVVGDKDEIS
ncbi:glycosyltransferase family 4 protein [Marinitoga arctica]